MGEKNNAFGLEKEGINSKITTTLNLPTTTHYIKSWGDYINGKQILIEQIDTSHFIYNFQGDIGIATIISLKDYGYAGKYGFVIKDWLFIFKNKSIFDAKWYYNTPSLEDCNKFVKGDLIPRPYKEIREDLKKRLNVMFDFSNAVELEISLLLIDQSWVKPLLPNFFFFAIDSSFGGGKTTLAEIVYKLVRHGFFAGDVSPASVPRLTDELDLNIFIDEIDQNLNDEDMACILRKGQRRGNPYVRCEGKNHVPVPYDVAGCHGFSFRSLMEDAIMNRSLRIHSKKSMDYQLPVINSWKETLLKKLADELFFWYIQNLWSIDVEMCSMESICSDVVEANVISREDIYEALTAVLSPDEKALLKEVFGRDNELVYLCLKTAKYYDINILTILKEIINNRRQEESSSQNLYLETLLHLILQLQGTILNKRLKEGTYAGMAFYPKNKLYQDFINHLKDSNLPTIGAKKFTSFLRDLGFVEGDTIKNQRYFENYPTACLIFTEEVCNKAGLGFQKIMPEERIEESN